MKGQFDVWRCNFPEKGGEHPAVLISHPDICARSAVVNVLFCTSQRQSRRPYPNEVTLDTADGMDWENLRSDPFSGGLWGGRRRINVNSEN